MAKGSCLCGQLKYEFSGEPTQKVKTNEISRIILLTLLTSGVSRSFAIVSNAVNSPAALSR